MKSQVPEEEADVTVHDECVADTQQTVTDQLIYRLQQVNLFVFFPFKNHTHKLNVVKNNNNNNEPNKITTINGQ